MKTQKNIKRNKLTKNKSKKQFLYNPNNPKKSFDVYIDKNPKNTIHKLERLYKSKNYTHKRIWQVGMIMKVRLEVLQDKKPEQYKLSKKYFDFLGKRTKLSNNKRYKLTFKD
jgi:hypothetical protein